MTHKVKPPPHHCAHNHGSNAHCDMKNNTIQPGYKLKLVSLMFLFTLLLSYLPVLQQFNASLIAYIQLIWWAVLLGLLIGGMVDYFVPDGFIYKHLGQHRNRSLLNAVLAGFVLSACSHGLLAIAIQLYKKGASVSAVITFLLASPWANFPMTLLLFGFFGWKALVFVLGAMLVALLTGLAYRLLEERQLVENTQPALDIEYYDWHQLTELNFRASVKGIFRGAVQLANMVLWWIIIGVVIAAVIKTWVPHAFIMSYFGSDFFGLLSTLAVATIIEVCSEGSSPIAFESYSAVGTLGNPFVFLMAGVITDYTEIGLLWSNIGKRTALWLPIITVPQVLLLGYVFNQVL